MVTNKTRSEYLSAVGHKLCHHTIGILFCGLITEAARILKHGQPRPRP
jgi:uncharacterized metal-binding protein